MDSSKERALTVSIHAPWEGCDIPLLQGAFLMLLVSIHAPWEGCDLNKHFGLMFAYSFNSRTLGRVRPCTSACFCFAVSVSIHAPWEGCDWVRMFDRGLPVDTFQFTHPGKGATTCGGDYNSIAGRFQFTHPGKGATTRTHGEALLKELFQFTHPGKGATRFVSRPSTEPMFQFTHPGKGATRS